MNWINEPLTLRGTKVSLLPLEESHFEALTAAAKAEIIWTYMPVRGYEPATLKAALQEALVLREKGEQYPFVVVENATQKIIGSTRFLKLNKEHRNLEIGWTWYMPEYWGRGHNEECKLLLMKHCFDVLKTMRVQIVTSDTNLRSRGAIARVGGKFEGILRSLMIRNGAKRNVAFYSILEEEWPEVKVNLERLCKEKANR